MENEKEKKRVELLGESWYKIVGKEFGLEYMKKLGAFVAQRRTKVKVYPEKDEVFKAMQLTPYEKVKVVILGQDPYNNGSANGLAFSKRDGFRGSTWIPASLEIILGAIQEEIPSSFNGRSLQGDLTTWAEQGVFLYNPILTVEHGRAGSHFNQGWERFSLRVIDALNRHPDRLVFLLWGRSAKAFLGRIDSKKHKVIQADHPAAATYRGTKWNSHNSFVDTNVFLKATNREEINW